MVILNRIQKNVKSKTSKFKKEFKGSQLADFLKLLYESLPKLFAGLKRLVAMDHCSTNAFTLKTMAKKKRDSLALLGVPLPPKVLYRFKS